jgi:hypothetical protein
VKLHFFLQEPSGEELLSSRIDLTEEAFDFHI